MTEISRGDYEALLGREIGVSRWIEVDQARIDAFADCTGDRQFIHVDPERARQGPFGGTIAHGFLVLSLLSEMNKDLPPIAGVRMTVNYGLNRLRFLTPVPAGGRIRGRYVLADVTETGPGEMQSTLDIAIELEGAQRPAVVLQWINRRYFGDT